MKMVQNYLNYGERNTESLAELFVTLLVKVSSILVERLVSQERKAKPSSLPLIL